ncbi:MAG: hypothetical protein KAI43_12740 [Candidatus Aureabacteria bacterium]|nr:hypothetical protein [Candidatus Auribacterota bacterium]
MDKRSVKMSLKGERGSMVVIALFITIILGFLVASLITFQAANYKQNISSTYRTKALFLAEAGIQKALYDLNFVPDLSGMQQLKTNDGTPDGTPDTSVAGIIVPNYYTYTNFTLGNIYVKINCTEILDGNDATGDVDIESTGTVTSVGTRRSYVRKLKVLARASGNPGAMFPAAISTLNNIQLKNGIIVDSFKKDAGGDPEYNTAGDDTSGIKSFANGDIIANGTTQLLNNSIVFGKIMLDTNEFAAGSVVDILQGEVYTYIDADSDNIPDNEQGTDSILINPAGIADHYVVGDTYTPDTQDVQLGAINIPYAVTSLRGATVTDGGETIAGGSSYVMNGPSVDAALTLSGGDYKFDGNLIMKNAKDIEITGDCRIYITGDFTMGNLAHFINTSTDALGQEVTHEVQIFCDGDVTFAHGADANTDGYTDPIKLQIYGTGSSGNINIAQGARWSGVVYAPNYYIGVNQGGDIYGSISGGTVDPKNSFQIHYDETLKELDGEEFESFTIASWSEVAP